MWQTEPGISTLQKIYLQVNLEPANKDIFSFDVYYVRNKTQQYVLLQEDNQQFSGDMHYHPEAD